MIAGIRAKFTSKNRLTIKSLIKDNEKYQSHCWELEFIRTYSQEKVDLKGSFTNHLYFDVWLPPTSMVRV